MHCQALYDNRFFRTHRADIFAGTATDTDFGVHMRNVETFFRVAKRQHFDGLNRAVFRAGGAVSAVGFDDAKTFLEYGCSYFLELFLLRGQEFYCAGRACFCATVAGVQTETFGVVHIRAHNSGKPPLSKGRF